MVKNDWEVRKWTLKAFYKSKCEEKEYEDERRGVFLFKLKKTLPTMFMKKKKKKEALNADTEIR